VAPSNSGLPLPPCRVANGFYSSVGYMRPKDCPAAKYGCLGGKATTCEAAGYILNVAIAQTGPPCRLPVFYPMQ
jgi:hypothetical protein